ncbi:isochorismate lyase [Oculatella sp. LEGE 06141]|uniref:isochorismate lyase n=1 Tax=Oculatella sp. LEGE 06141 TaxID=1828648 RepID=UPI0018805B39|nr:isochorismate lyase [Oculatella sp. LEGE 06141]MBE9180352.1 isochorismate lyase [Oculatella sp. LEGE 06141]
MKSPEDCTTMSDIRAEIDRLDRQVIALWGQRFAYVKAASRFKTSEASVKAPERVQTVLNQRREWAEAEGLNPDIVEKLYHDLIHYFVEEEINQWRSLAISGEIGDDSNIQPHGGDRPAS